MAIEQKILTFGANKMGTIGGKLMGYTKPFFPTDITDCILWLDNQETDFIKTGANKVSQWSDKSGLNNHFIQGTGANQPLFVANGINGQNGVYFSNSADNHLNRVFSTTYSQPFTIVTVWNLDSSSTGANPVVYDRSTTISNRVILYWTGSQVAVGSPTLVNAYAKTRPFSLIQNLVEFNSTNTKVYENGVLKNTLNTGTASLIDMRLGLSAPTSTSAARLSGYICEHFIYSRVLTVDEQTQINTYLAAKYGL